MKLTNIIKGEKAVFVEFHSGMLFYDVDGVFRFPIPVEDLHGACIGAEEKPSVFMKWIRKAYKEINSEKS